MLNDEREQTGTGIDTEDVRDAFEHMDAAEARGERSSADVIDPDARLATNVLSRVAFGMFVIGAAGALVGLVVAAVVDTEFLLWGPVIGAITGGTLGGLVAARVSFRALDKISNANVPPAASSHVIR